VLATFAPAMRNAVWRAASLCPLRAALQLPMALLQAPRGSRPNRNINKGAESCERRWGNQPGNLPVGVAPVGLVGVVAGASVDSMGLLPQQ
jgi:hypothetical protein